MNQNIIKKGNTITFLQDKYQQMSLPLKASFWFVICNFAQRGVSMITTPIFARILPEEEYGIFGIFSSWTVIFEIIVSLYLGSCAMILYTQNDNKEDIISSLSGLQLVIGLFWIAIYFIVPGAISSLLRMPKVLCLCMFLTVVSNQMIYLWMGYKKFIYEYKSIVLITVMITVFSSLFGIIVVSFISSTAVGRLLPSVLVNVLAAVIIFLSIQKKSHMFFNKKIWLFALGFGIPLIPHAVSQFVLSTSDRLMINAMCGTRDVAMYSIANSVGSIISIFTSAINASFSPYQYQQIKNKNYKTLSRRADQVMFIIAILLLGIMLFGNEIVLIFGGKRYEESGEIIIPICLGVYFAFLFQIFSRVQEYYLHRATLVIASTSCAILNLILNYMFIPIVGYQAAAYTTFVCYLIFCFFHYLFYRRVLKIDLDGNKIYNIKNLSVISICLIISGFFIEMINHILLVKYILIFVILIICIIKRKNLVKKIVTLKEKK